MIYCELFLVIHELKKSIAYLNLNKQIILINFIGDTESITNCSRYHSFNMEERRVRNVNNTFNNFLETTYRPRQI
jgi:hypothetical protein